MASCTLGPRSFGALDRRRRRRRAPNPRVRARIARRAVPSGWLEPPSPLHIMASLADAPTLQANWECLSAEEQATATMLLSAGQAHLFAGWPALGVQDAEKKRLLAQARSTSSSQLPTPLSSSPAGSPGFAHARPLSLRSWTRRWRARAAWPPTSRAPARCSPTPRRTRIRSRATCRPCPRCGSRSPPPAAPQPRPRPQPADRPPSRSAG